MAGPTDPAIRSARMAATLNERFATIKQAESAEIAAAGSLGPIDPKAVGKWAAIFGGAGVAVYAFSYLVIRTPPHDYQGERKARIVEYQRVAADHPGNKAALAELKAAFDDRDGHIDAGFAAQNEYDARCKDKP